MLINLKGMLSESRQSQKIESYIHNSTNKNGIPEKTKL